MKRFKFAVIAVVLAAVLAFSVCAHADFGNYAGDYDYGGGFDSYDYGADYDSYDYGDYDSYDSDDSADSYGGGYYYVDSNDDNSGDDGGSSPLGIVFAALFVILIIVVIISAGKKKGTSKQTRVMPGATPTNAASLKRIDEYLGLDPDFSESEFKEKVANMYVQFQNAWQKKDMEELRPYLTESLYAQCERQLQEFRRNKQTNRVERIAVLDVNPVGWKQQDGNDIMVVRLRTRIVDYVVDDASGNVVRGSNTAEKFMEYEWSLARTSGKKTSDFTGTQAHSCPHCGAPLELNKSAKCEYCGSIIETDTFNWAVREIKGISQRTAQ